MASVTATIGTVTLTNLSELRFSRNRSEIGENTNIRVDAEETSLVGIFLPPTGASFADLEG